MSSTGLNSPRGDVKIKDTASEAEEQIYLLEIIVESVKVEKEGILDEFKVAEEPVTASATAVAPATDQTAEPSAQTESKKKEEEALGATKVVMKFFEFPSIEITEKEYVTPMTSAAIDSTKNPADAGSRVESATVVPTGETPETTEGAVGPSQVSIGGDGEAGKKPEDSQPKIKHTTGKSCLFPMMPMKLVEVIKKHPLEIQLSRAAGKGPRAMPAHVIGQTRIHLDHKFIDTVTLATTPIILPISASVENSFDLKNVFGDTTAKIKLVVRLSCFGSNIFTQFNYIKGEEGFQFKTSTSTMGGKLGGDEKKKKEEEERKRKGLAVDFDYECSPEFADDTTMGFLLETPAAKKADAFRRAVPWRMLKEDVPMPKICGPKNLFVEKQPPIKCPFQKDKINLKEMFPSLAFKPGISTVPGEPKQQPREFGARQELMPGQAGTSYRPVEALPGTKFPCQFGSSWLPDSETPKGLVCTNKMSVPGGQYTGGHPMTPSVCSCLKKPTSDVTQPMRFQPGVANAPPFPRSPAPLRCVECECGLPDRSKKKAQGPLGDENKIAFPPNPQNPLDRVPCPFFKNEVRDMMQNRQKETIQCPAFIQEPSSSPDPWNQQMMDSTGTQACPAFMPSRQPQQEPMCGLSALATPEQQNLKNLLARPIMPPACPPDSAQGITSLCTCPKVATPEQQLNFGPIRCECSNIMSSIKPIDMPFSCPCPTATAASASQQARVQPVPINLPPPPPDCPLAQLLQEVATAERKQQAQQPAPSSSPFAPSSQIVVTGVGPANQQRVDISQPTITGGGKDKSEPDLSRDDAKKGAKHKGKKKTFKTASSQELSESTDKGPEEIPKVDNTGDMTDDKGKAPKRSPEEKAKATLKDEVQAYDEDTTELDSAEKIAMPGGQKSKQKKKGGDDQQDEPSSKRTSGLPPFIGEKEAEIAYTYTAGMYPGVHVGHKDCVPVYQLVPKNMGWLWNVREGSGYLRPGRGWRPGSIQTQVMKVIDYVKKSEKENVKPKGRPLGVAKAHSGKLKSSKETGAQQQAPLQDELKMAGGAMLMGGGDGSASTPAAVNTGPTLHLHKSHGVYYVSLYPPKQSGRKDSPSRKKKKGKFVEAEDEKPVQFRIDPKNPDGDEKDPGLYETDDTSTDSADSYELEFVTPNTMAHRIVKPVKRNMEIQVAENELQPPGKKGLENDNKSKTSLGSTGKSIKKKGTKPLRSSKGSKGSGGSKGKAKGKGGKPNKNK